MELNIPFYVRLHSSGPNNTSHTAFLDHLCAYTGETSNSPQVFKVVIVDKEYKEYKKEYKDMTTYITEDGYCLWPICVTVCTEEEYNTERKLNYIPLIFN